MLGLHGTAGMREKDAMAGQGSTGNVVAVLSSFIRGLGQLIQGRPLKGC